MDKAMIPLSVIDAKIAEIEKMAYMSTTMEISPFEVMLDTLKEIKKEAIFVSLSTNEPPQWQQVTDNIAKRLEKCLATEQKIRDRIKELEPLADMTEQIPAECLNDPTIYNIVVQTRVDELRKLLEPSPK